MSHFGHFYKMLKLFSSLKVVCWNHTGLVVSFFNACHVCIIFSHFLAKVKCIHLINRFNFFFISLAKYCSFFVKILFLLYCTADKSTEYHKWLSGIIIRYHAQVVPNEDVLQILHMEDGFFLLSLFLGPARKWAILTISK